ncbi:MAG: ABC transporter permease [Phycisphaerae bacterium]|nr:ABC transporter permease [Phycisphaerae bacterium]
MSERRSRTGLLMASVALSSALIVAVSCAMASLDRAIKMRVDATVGAGDVRVRHVGGTSFDAALVERVRGWPEVELAVGRLMSTLTLQHAGTGTELIVDGVGVDIVPEARLRPRVVLRGRGLAGDGEVVLEEPAARDLKAEPGDVLRVARFGDEATLRVVGVVKPLPLGMIGRPAAYTSLRTMGELAERRGRVTSIDAKLRGSDRATIGEGVIATATAVVERYKGTVPKGIAVQATERVTSGLYKNMQSNQVGLAIAAVLSFLSAAFIIMTGLTTDVTERQRELSVLRCIGAERGQLAESQLAHGLIVGGLGASAGVPLGMAMGLVLVLLFPEQLPGGLSVSTLGVTLAFAGSVGAGLLGAAFPAWTAARSTPLSGLQVRARAPRRAHLALCAAAGLIGVGLQLAVVTLPRDGNLVFWGHVSLGLPVMFCAYFLLGVPTVWIAARAAGPWIARLLRLPPRILTRAIAATPFRYGFTSGAMMVGLALMVIIWTNGRSVMQDWVSTLEFPDAFVHGFALDEAAVERIRALPFVEKTCAITLQAVETDAFGIRGLSAYKTTFIAFEPETFFSMTMLRFIEGDPERAKRRLAEGGAVLVAKEFKVARGLGVGDRLKLGSDGRSFEFEIVGVVSSPGLDIASKFFDIGDQYLDQAVNAVFGSRRDLTERFGNDTVNLVQIAFTPGVKDDAVLSDLRRAAGPGVLGAGSGRQIKEEIRAFIAGSLFVFSFVAVAAMLVACLGVANLIVASIQGRQFEFGVLRAVGAPRGLLARLIVGEALVVALAACVLGTLMGIQGAWTGQRINAALIGLSLTVRPPVGPIAAGWGIVTVITLAAALPSILSLNRKHPRELLAAMKG